MLKQSNNDDKRTLILDAALKLFCEFGFHATPTSKIAIEAGVAHGTIFHYFKTKDELIFSLYVHIRDKSYEYLNENQVTGDFEKRFQNLFFHSVQWGLKNPENFDFRIQFENSPYLRKFREDGDNEIKSLHMDLFIAGQEAGVLKDLDPQMIGVLVKSNIHGTYNYIVNNKFKVAERKETINRIGALVWLMIKK